MTRKQELSEKHAAWLEDERAIPSEIAAEKGVVSLGTSLGLSYIRNGECVFRKLRTRKAGGSKAFYIDPKGAELFLWNWDCLLDPAPGASLIITEGEPDALSVLSVGESCVVSVPNGAGSKAGEGDIDPDQDRAFAYLWSGSMLRPELAQFSRIILMTDGSYAGMRRLTWASSSIAPTTRYLRPTSRSQSRRTANATANVAPS